MITGLVLTILIIIGIVIVLGVFIGTICAIEGLGFVLLDVLIGILPIIIIIWLIVKLCKKKKE